MKFKITPAEGRDYSRLTVRDENGKWLGMVLRTDDPTAKVGTRFYYQAAVFNRWRGPNRIRRADAVADLMTYIEKESK